MDSPSLKEGTQNEVCSMLASSMHVTLTPLFPKLSDLNYDRPWKQFDVSMKDFCHPKIAVEKANLTSELGFFENAVGSVEDILKLCAGTMEFLTPEAKQRIFPGLPKSVPGTTFVPGSVKTYPKISDIFSAAIHSTGMTIVKTFEDDTENIDVFQDTIITLKTTLNSINKKLAEKIAQDHRKRNLNRRFDSISDQMSTWMGR